MDQIISTIQSLLPAGVDISSLFSSVLTLCTISLVISLIARFVFGKKSNLNRSISSAINILFIYVITVAVHSLGVNLTFLISPLPFISLEGDYLHILNLLNAEHGVICDQILSMIILAFLANLADGWLPEGKKVISWFFFRCISVLLAMVLHLIATAVINALVPEGLMTWAPTVLLCLLVLMLAVGALKLLVGIILATVNPIIGALYTFFFANVVGKMLSKAILTAGMITAIILVLNYFGISSILVAASALLAYIPFLVILLIIWYVIGHLL